MHIGQGIKINVELDHEDNIRNGLSFNQSVRKLRAEWSLTDDEVSNIEAWLNELIGTIKIRVSHDAEKDLTISADVEIEGKSIPLELLGMGYLQLIQIFCYLLLFRPKVLLIDEPDIHLHPNVQEKLLS